MNILILTGSPRKNGNTDMLAKAFADGASSKGHNVDTISVGDVNVSPCMGCNRCFANEKMECVQHDDMQGIYERMKCADMLVIASPMYFYSISAQLKAIIDRCHNPIRDTFKISKAALLLVGASSLPTLFDAALAEYKLCIGYFNIEDAGHILVRGMKEKGDIRHTDALKQAYAFGESMS